MEEIVGRDAELEAIEHWLENPQPPTLLIEGEPGIGKTTLWRSTVARAKELRMQILVSTPTEAEARLPYSALADVVHPIMAEVVEQLALPQRRALETALLLREPGERSPDEGAVAVATLNALRRVGHSTLVAVDDAQWVDRSSSTALASASRRIGDTDDVHMVLSRRRGSSSGLDPSTDAERLRVGPLSLGAIHHIVSGELGSSLTRPALMRVHKAAAGNPLYAVELARAELAADPVLTRDQAPTLTELVRRRLSAMPEPTRDVLLLVAAASDPTPAMLSEAVGADALEMLDPAFGVGLVEQRGNFIRFAHPVLASAIYADVPEHVRREAHRRLANATTSVEERGHHLAYAATEPDPDIAAAIERAGESVRGRGARADATDLLERAAELTPTDEPESRARRLVIAADCSFESGAAQRARALLEQAAELGGSSRPEALWRLGRILDETEGFDRTRPEWQEALRAGDLALVVNVRRSMALAGLFVDGETALRDAVAGVEIAERLGETRPLELALAMEAYVRGVLGDPTYREPLDRALALEDEVEVDELYSPSAVLADLGRLSLDLEAGRRGYEAVLRRAEDVGDARTETWCAYGLGMVETLSGNLPRASELAQRAHDLSEQVTLLGLPAVRLCALVAACQGDVERCRELLEACDVTARKMGDKVNLLGTLAIDGFLELSLGRQGAAVEPLDEAWTIQAELGIREPGVTRFLVDFVEALAATGRLDDAERAAAVFLDQVDQLRREWARPLVGRAAGLILVACDDTTAALAKLDEAVNGEDLLPMPLERGRTLLVLGALRRRARQRRAAREALQQALAIFENLGAPLWADQARAELSRLGGRAPTGDELTPGERRIAELVAEGMTNKEVAAALVVTNRTVESALTQIYRKLDVRSRTQLARKLTSA
jgi:DNA-binding NarL/FixJ family response regulator